MLGCPSGCHADPLGVQQTGQELHAVLGHGQDSLVCDTHGAEPLVRMISEGSPFVPGVSRFAPDPARRVAYALSVTDCQSSLRGTAQYHDGN
jgi:hypothetical protein